MAPCISLAVRVPYDMGGGEDEVQGQFLSRGLDSLNFSTVRGSRLCGDWAIRVLKWGKSTLSDAAQSFF